MKTASISNWALFHLFFPHQCIGCGSDILSHEQLVCLGCIQDLPHTRFALHANNPVEKIFWGRIVVQNAMSEFYFSKSSVIQNLIHEMKYRGNTKAGMYLGNLMGRSLKESVRFADVDCLVPLPLFAKKEKHRGYNQSEILCKGIQEILPLPIITKNVIRVKATETQTKKGRTERWQNVDSTFAVSDGASLAGKHVLLVDDVITTGATLEACAGEILKTTGARVSIATLAMAMK